MALLKHLERVQAMHRMIKFKRTGPPDRFATQLGISESFLYRLLGDLKRLGAPISYSHARESYVYARPVELHLGFNSPTLAETELRQVGGGARVRYLDLGWRWNEQAA